MELPPEEVVPVSDLLMEHLPFILKRPWMCECGICGRVLGEIVQESDRVAGSAAIADKHIVVLPLEVSQRVQGGRRCDLCWTEHVGLRELLMLLVVCCLEQSRVDLIKIDGTGGCVFVRFACPEPAQLSVQGDATRRTKASQYLSLSTSLSLWSLGRISQPSTPSSVPSAPPHRMLCSINSMSSASVKARTS